MDIPVTLRLGHCHDCGEVTVRWATSESETVIRSRECKCQRELRETNLRLAARAEGLRIALRAAKSRLDNSPEEAPELSGDREQEKIERLELALKVAESRLESEEKARRKAEARIDYLCKRLQGCASEHTKEYAGLRQQISDLQFKLNNAEMRCEHRGATITELREQIAVLEGEIKQLNAQKEIGR